MVAVVVVPKAVAVKVAGEPAVAVVKGMAEDGQVERVNHPAEGAALHRLSVAKSRFRRTGVTFLKQRGTRKQRLWVLFVDGGPSGQRFANKEVSWRITINVPGVIALCI